MQSNKPLNDRLTAYVDGELSAEEREMVARELERDARLRREHDLERGVKNLLSSRKASLRESVPISLEQDIRTALVLEAIPDRTATGSRTRPVHPLVKFFAGFRRPAFAIPLALGSLAVIVYMAVQIPSPLTQSGGSALVDLYEVSYANFEKVVRGEITLAKTTSNTAELDNFFRSEGVDYQVFYPEVDAVLLGGVVSQHGSKRFAHLVYSVGQHIVYIFEVDAASVEQNVVDLNSVVAQDLQESRWHWEERSNVGTMFVWKSNNVICSAVSDLRTPEFSALFTLDKL